MLTGRSIYIFQLDVVLATMGSTDAIIAKAVKAKISSLWIKIAESAMPSANVRNSLGEHLRDLVATGSANGIAIFGWHVPYCADEGRTDNEIKLLTRLVTDLDLAGVVIDNEDGHNFFKGNAATAARYGAGLRAAMQAAGKIVAMSSNDIISWHPGAYATVIGQYIDVNAPQVYYGGSRSVASRLDQAARENDVILKPFFPVGVCVVEPKGENEGAFSDAAKCAAWTRDFIGLVSQSHRASPDMVPGYGFWDWDQSTEEFWRVLYDTEVFIAPGAAARSAVRGEIAEAVADASVASGSTTTGWTLEVKRVRSDRREGEGFDRTVGAYRVLHDGVPQSALVGATVERQGPGDNGPIGKAQHRCIAAGSYPLRDQATAKYRTVGYATDGSHPRPALDVGDTGDRDGILVHPADGYGSTIGCINLSRPLSNGDSDILWPDSVERVVAVIEDLRNFLGGKFVLNEDGSIASARIVISDRPNSARMSFAEAAFAAAPGEDCLIYEQSTGRMSVREGGKLDSIGVGYSGSLSGGGRNDPSKQCVKMVGPIPRGRYTIGPPILGPSPYSLRLTPDTDNDMCGRGDFLIHGDSSAHPGNASEGCIILSRPEREAIVKTGLQLLIVVDGVST